MKGTFRVPRYYNIFQLQGSRKAVENDPGIFIETLRTLVDSAFATPAYPGIIAQRLQYYLDNPPLHWSEEFNSVVQLFSPNSVMVRGPSNNMVGNQSEEFINIEAAVLPREVQEEMTGSLMQKKSKILPGLKRQTGGKLYLKSWEWLWAHIAQALMTQPELQPKRSLKQDHQEDELFFLLTRNPYLAIIRAALDFEFPSGAGLKERCRSILELYVIGQLHHAVNRKDGKIDTKFTLKSHHLALIFLLIYSRRSRMTGDALQTYHQYFRLLTEHFSSIIPHPSSRHVPYLLRSWCYLLTCEHSFDSKMVKLTQHANPHQGYYKLSRCRIEEWASPFGKVQLLYHMADDIITVRKNLFRLLSRKQEWTPSFSLLAAVEQFLTLDKVFLNRMTRREPELEEKEAAQMCIETTLTFLLQNEGDCKALKEIQMRLNASLIKRLPRALSVNLNERYYEYYQKLSRTNRENLKGVSYQCPRIRSVWEHPLQENQFYILLTFWRGVASQIDRIIPGHSHRPYPYLNLRIMASPLVTIIFLLLTILLVRCLVNL